MILRKAPTNRADDRALARDDALFLPHVRAVFAVCLALSHNYHDAEDITQSVLMNAIAKGKSPREPARARAWLLQVARRMCVDFHRERKHAEPLLDDPPSPVSESSAAGERLHEAIGRLPANYREAIVLYYLDGRDCASLAATLGITAAAARQRLVRARALLHQLLREDPR
ncbi:MAG: RNA polymerase sigma factor [Isosphaeraceae bacterium]